MQGTPATPPRAPHGGWPPPLAALLWLGVFGAALALGPSMLGGDADLATHLRYGALIIERGGLPSSDPLLYTTGPDDRLILHEWLYEVAVAWLYDLFGWSGPLLASAALAASAVAGAHLFMRRRGVATTVALGASLLAFLACRVHLAARPHLVSWALLPPLWALVARARDRGIASGRELLGAAALGALWANLHGGFVLAVALVVAAALGAAVDRARRRAPPDAASGLLALAAALSLGSLANPWGPMLHLHLLRFLLDPFVVRGTYDFRAPGLQGGSAIVLALLLLASALLLRRGRGGLQVSALAPWALTAVSAVGSTRQLPYLGLVLCLTLAPLGPAAAGGLSSRLASVDPPALPLRWPLLALLAALLARGVLPARPDPARYPEAALEYLRARPEVLRERPYADYLLGGYLLQATDVDAVNLHPLNANYPRSLLRDYLVLRDARAGWPELLLRYDARWTLQVPDAPLVRALDRHRCWRRVQADGRSVVHRLEPGCPFP
jgi:hypothetical protein